MKGITRKIVSLVLVVSLIASFCSYAAVVTDNDASAFVTKAEFEAIKNNVQGQIDAYNNNLDNAIDGAIAAYLANFGGGTGGANELGQLKDVKLDTPKSGNVLYFDGTNWVNQNFGTLGISDLTSSNKGNILVWDGNKWVNAVQTNKIDELNIALSSDGSDAKTTELNAKSDGTLEWGDNDISGDVEDITSELQMTNTKGKAKFFKCGKLRILELDGLIFDNGWSINVGSENRPIYEHDNCILNWLKTQFGMLSVSTEGALSLTVINEGDGNNYCWGQLVWFVK